ncbi:hypothetical protein [Streptomyces hygroscopicus]|nr:hypothetical protein [Streptomyces hygroscopicus]GLV76704.1 hypothetical protein Shyhy02_47040 [Streptomyces hygroscopicus subsp. hygroscopicus]
MAEILTTVLAKLARIALEALVAHVTKKVLTAAFAPGAPAAA